MTHQPAATDAGVFALKTGNLPEPQVRELPDPPRRMWRLIGPGIVASGVGLASGEFILWPYITSQVGLVFLWGAALGLTIQWFLNMEIERYTLATGETALSGFNRYWKHWGLFFVVLAVFQNLWPGWATAAATMFTYLFGGNATVVAVIMLLAIGAMLTLAPVVYTLMERLLIVKIVAVGLFFLVAVTLALKADTWQALPDAVTHVGQFPGDIEFAVLMGAIAFAGAGGGQNLCQSNWIRDKGFGMGSYIPRLVSPITGEKVAAPSTTAFVFEPTPANLSRWQRWWRFANLEQALTFALITFLTILLTSMLAHSTVLGSPGLENSIDFLNVEGEALKGAVGGWFGTLFWVVGMFSLFAAAAGIVDYTSRLVADILKGTYLGRRSVSENRLYFGAVWVLVLTGVTILAAGLDQPLVLLVISACVAGLSMFFYSTLLLVMNRGALPRAIRVGRGRAAVLIFSTGFFGVLSAVTIYQQIQKF
ncbi:Nramp family divalent metal transporter [Kineosporia babensis]|uniref:Nramp family divalent metal transporter n=1 Tax=Kineosporia babensis TaxID=499548 RepID=A0A9X1NBH3_9ACTN|nr:Nramp family divalent metal transporter [Kineosporia babensis]MCD5311902.1 Nramp family divalent metal transporter [Kineosporia babensis]